VRPERVRHHRFQFPRRLHRASLLRSRTLSVTRTRLLLGSIAAIARQPRILFETMTAVAVFTPTPAIAREMTEHERGSTLVAGSRASSSSASQRLPPEHYR
jgi:hypothetical protein